jgi:hypothetical protein
MIYRPSCAERETVDLQKIKNGSPLGRLRLRKQMLEIMDTDEEKGRETCIQSRLIRDITLADNLRAESLTLGGQSRTAR